MGTGCFMCGKVKRGMHDGYDFADQPIKCCRACATKYGWDFSDAPTPPAYWSEEDKGELQGGFSSVGAVLSA